MKSSLPNEKTEALISISPLNSACRLNVVISRCYAENLFEIFGICLALSRFVCKKLSRVGAFKIQSRLNLGFKNECRNARANLRVGSAGIARPRQILRQVNYCAN